MSVVCLCLTIVLSACGSNNGRSSQISEPETIVPQNSELSNATSHASALTPTMVVPVHTPPSIDRAKDWSISWLQGLPCRPPCWEGIIPGQTTADEAVTVLLSNPLVLTATMAPSPLSPKDGIVTWSWRYQAGSSEAYYDLQTSSQKIVAVRVHFPTSLPFADMMQAYGEPSHIMAYASHGPDIGAGLAYELALVYQSDGFVIYTSGSGLPALDENTRFNQIVFFAPTNQGTADGLKLIGISLKELIPWRGFQDVTFYCQDDEEGRACQGK
jgi:hypothetical protein